MPIKVYGYKKCGTCRKAEKYLEAVGIDYNFIDITVDPPAKTALKKMISQSGKGIEKFYNTSGIKYKELDIKTKRKELNEAEQIELLASNGYLLKRPIVTDGSQTTVAFIEDEFKENWK